MTGACDVFSAALAVFIDVCDRSIIMPRRFISLMTLLPNAVNPSESCHRKNGHGQPFRKKAALSQKVFPTFFGVFFKLIKNKTTFEVRNFLKRRHRFQNSNPKRQL